MTFSTKAVVDAVQDRFVPVWESVAPVHEAVFDLGDGTSVKGTVGGEIALWFCRPDGTVFDVLPALQSPARTLAAIDRAATFFAETGATSSAIARLHTGALAEPGALSPEAARAARDRAHGRLGLGRTEPEPATRDLTEMALSKVLLVTPTESITVVEPGGLAVYRALVHEMLSQGEERTPEGWKHELFETILEQELTGGTTHYDVDTIAPLSLVD